MRYPLLLRRSRAQLGFALIEALAGIFVLSILVVAVTGLSTLLVRTGSETERRLVALGLANEQIEQIRALPYEDVGTQSGDPAGSLTPTKDVKRNGQGYTLNTTVAWQTDDTTPRYKKARIEASWTAAGGQPRRVVIITYVTSLPTVSLAWLFPPAP